MGLTDVKEVTQFETIKTMKKKSFHNLKPVTLQRLTEIFIMKNWNLEFDEFKGYFERFCRLLSLLSEDEQKIVLTLTEDFLFCPFTIYVKLLTDALFKVNSIIFNNSRNIFLIPLLSPEDIERGKNKSGHILPYLMQHMVIPSADILQDKKIIALTSLDKLSPQHNNRKNALIIFLDDFIGSGDTAIKCINYYNSYHRIEDEAVLLISLVAQEQGINAIVRLGLTVYAAIIRNRGISDSPKFYDTANAINIMQHIEDRLLINKSYLFGYGRCEALVKMIRTPNNTFPLYWCSRGKNDLKWPAPFPR